MMMYSLLYFFLCLAALDFWLAVDALATPSHGVKSFERWLEVETWRSPNLRDVQPAMVSLAGACRQINSLIRRTHTDDLGGKATGLEGAVEVNVQGEEQKKLDVVSNDLLKTLLCASGSLYCVASEEEDEPCTCSRVVGGLQGFDGDLVAMFDPLDGSSNVDAGLATGTIFGILRHPAHIQGSATREDLLQPGSRLVAAGYCLYGASTTLVCSLGSGVHGFTLDESRQVFVHTHHDMRIPRRGRAVMFNHGNYHGWETGIQQFVRDAQAKVAAEYVASAAASASLQAGKGATAAAADDDDDDEAEAAVGRYFKYSGAFVGDVHSLLTKGGGVFGYPADTANPTGKLRLLYESNPMAFLVEQAGGVASTGTQRILDVPPHEVHQRVPTFLGSADDVFELSTYMNYRSSPDMWI